MSQSSNPRCSCFCRPQIPAPPCMNTDCKCNNVFTPPPPMPPMPQFQPPTLPVQPEKTAISGGCGCGTQPPLMPNTNLNQMPIGMGYVPWQRWGQTYPIEQGFSRGTIFPELDFPFVMGRCR
ncbi:MAG: spore coat associated protein CotJA [Lachnospiraceae bacterium]|nr:spore coat associated protein CotJA [Lachnospiraceae bacterium]